MRKIIFGYFLWIAAVIAISAGIRYVCFADIYTGVTDSDNDITYVSKIEGKNFYIQNTEGVWEQSFLTGVNMGTGIPGSFPGEFNITQDMYFKWFEEIGAMNANILRVYVPQMPDFYDALFEYNSTAKEPLYLIQGVYVDEDAIEENPNLLDHSSGVMGTMENDIMDAINMIHGNAVIEQTAGKAYGTYHADVSQYVAGWILGIEFSANIVNATNAATSEQIEAIGVKNGEFQGDYVYTQNASPMEQFLARECEVAISYETLHYKMQRPVAVCNWLTTDPLEHPNEPFEQEDSETIDVTNMKAKDTFIPGFFASYHVYPYYPEFIKTDEKYQDSDKSSYQLYLEELVNYHTMPVLVSEFGVSSSRGVAHFNEETGFDQGNMTEEEQGEAIAVMLDEISESGCAGGIVFSWQDEWFKRTWNTMDYDDSTRRPYWHNVQTAEQGFGILAFDDVNQVTLDGDTSEWTSDELVVSEDNLSLYAKTDSAYLYLLAEVDDFENGTYVIPIDTILGQGNFTNSISNFENAADFLVVLSGEDNSTVLVDPYYNVEYKNYGTFLFDEEEIEQFYLRETGEFVSITQAINRALYYPETNQYEDCQLFDAGKLTYGISDANSENYNSLSDFYASDNKVEIRIPWMLLNFADPSTKEIISNLQNNDDFSFETIEQIKLGIGKNTVNNYISMEAFTWDNWTEPTVVPRRKNSYSIIQHTFSKYNSNEGVMDQKSEVFRIFRNVFLREKNFFKHLHPIWYAVFFVSSVVVYMIFVLFYINRKLTAGRKRWYKNKKILHEDILEYQLKGSLKKNYWYSRFLCTRAGTHLLNDIYLELSNQEKEFLTGLLLKSKVPKYVKRNLGVLDNQNQLVKLAGNLKLKECEEKILKIYQKGNKYLDVRYNCLLALSLMECKDSILEICQTEDFGKILSFPCMKEIFDAYGGYECEKTRVLVDKQEICECLLLSQNVNVKRIGIYLLGEYQDEKSKEILKSLLSIQTKDLLGEVLIGLGKQKNFDAGEQIVKFTKHVDWKIRKEAYEALGEISFAQYEKVLIGGLSDTVWVVRFTCGCQLAKSDRRAVILADLRRDHNELSEKVLKYAIAKHTLAVKEKRHAHSL